MSISASTGAVSGTPLNADVGSSTITVTVTDAAGASASDTFVLTVDNTNDAPTSTSGIADTSVNEDGSLYVVGVFTDVDVGDSLSYSMSGAPSTLSIDTSTGAISGTPLNDDVGAHTITVTATDVAGATGDDVFVLTVVNTNDAPTVTSPIADASIDEDASYSLAVSSAITDVDVGDTLAYSMSGAPSSLSID
ncbi:uncharacterized protein METZ01_LOCUS329301, partial [marine metagenome]